MNIDITVFCLTYNHADYIRDALESFLMQKTRYTYNVFVYDDASTDGTSDILREYEKKYPEIFDIYISSCNIYNSPEREKIMDKLYKEHIVGRYVAWCEGDDYWTDSNKLQKQIEFMEQNPECSMTAHGAYWLDCQTGVLKDYNPYNENRYLAGDEIILQPQGNLPTASLVIRKDAFIRDIEFPACDVGDIPMQLYALCKGEIYYFNCQMSLYRYMHAGSWTKEIAGAFENNNIHAYHMIDFMEKYHISAYDEKTGKGLVRHVLIRCGFSSQEKMVCLIINGKSLPHGEKLVEALRKIDGMTSISLNCNTERTNVILGHKTIVLWGQEYITDQIGDISYEISPVSFYQVNPVQTEKLYGLALEYADLHGEETVWDLYCGIGTISLFLAQKAKQVYGVEIIPQAIENAKRNAVKNGIENAEFFVGKSEEVLPEFYEKEAAAGRKAHADVIVVDPPRKGCDEKLLDTIVKMAPDRVVYVSCDSATLARDLKILCEQGYELKRVRAVDQFCHTVHTEAVCCLHRVNM